MEPFSLGLGVINGLTSLGGLLGASAAKRRAEAARQQALIDMSKNLDEEYRGLVDRNRKGLLGATGLGGDALVALGGNLGAGLANAGVYNSSATAGALTQAQANTGAQLANLAQQNNFDEKSLLGQNQRYLTGMRLNFTNQDLGQAQSDLSGARSGLASFLGSLGQFNLANSGANQVQNKLGRASGGYGSSMPLAPGAGLLGGLPQLGAYALQKVGNYNPLPQLKPLW